MVDGLNNSFFLLKIPMNDSNNCLFCKIINKEIPANITFEDDNFIVFKDINPKANLHLLIVPKEHIASLAHLQYNHKDLMGEAMLLLNKIALDNNVTNGYRTIVNTGRGGGQEIDHIHLHLLAGNLPAFG